MALSPTKQVALSWSDSELSRTYDVSRGPSCSGELTIVNAAPVITTSYPDSPPTGTYCYRVTPRDGFDRTPAESGTIIVDKIAPAAPAFSPAISSGGAIRGVVLVSSTDSGGSGLDTVTLTVDGLPVAPLPWDTASAIEGAHNLSAVATDGAGNFASTTITGVIVDRTAPSAPSLDAIALTGGKTAGPITVGGTFPDEPAPGSGLEQQLYEIRSAGGSYATIPAGAWGVVQADGPYELRARSVDKAGNESVSPVFAFVLDNTTPTTPVVPVSSLAFTAAAPVVAWNASTSQDVLSYEVLRDGVVIAPTVAGIVHVDAALALDGTADGSHSYTVRAFDGIHSSAPSLPLPIVVDTTAPGAPGGATATLRGDRRSVAIAWTVPADVASTNGFQSGVDRIVVRRKTGTSPTTVTDGAAICDLLPTVTTCIDAAPPEGEAVVYAAFAVDRAANTTAAATTSLAIPDLTPPAAASGLKVVRRGTAVTLRWTNPARDLDHVVVVRNASHAPATPTDGTVAFSGLAATTGAVVKAGRKAWFAVFVLDRACNRSPAAVVFVKVRRSRVFPIDGSDLAAADRLTWARVSGATYYNVQVWLGKKKVAEGWPTDPGWKPTARKLKVGKRYTWYVWPGVGAKAAATYGKLIGSARFTWRG